MIFSLCYEGLVLLIFKQIWMIRIVLKKTHADGCNCRETLVVSRHYVDILMVDILISSCIKNLIHKPSYLFCRVSPNQIWLKYNRLRLMLFDNIILITFLNHI